MASDPTGMGAEHLERMNQAGPDYGGGPGGALTGPGTHAGFDQLGVFPLDAAEARIRALELEQQAKCVGPDGATGAVGSSGLSTEEALRLRAAEVQERLGADAVGFKRQSLPPDRMLQFFTYAHLPLHLQEASEPFCLLAYRLVERYPSNPERTVALRKLLEAKDAAVRALLYQG